MQNLKLTAFGRRLLIYLCLYTQANYNFTGQLGFVVIGHFVFYKWPVFCEVWAIMVIVIDIHNVSVALFVLNFFGMQF